MFHGTPFALLGRRDEDGLPLPPAQGPDGAGPHLGDMETLLHRTQSRLDDLRLGHHEIIAVNHVLTAELEGL